MTLSKLSECSSEPDSFFQTVLKTNKNKVIDRALLTRKQHERLLAIPKPIPKPPPPPKRKVKRCPTPPICPERIDQLSIPKPIYVLDVLQKFNTTLEPDRVVRLVKLVQAEKDEDKSKSPTRKARRKKKKKPKRKIQSVDNCRKVWLKKRVCLTTKLIMKYIKCRDKKLLPNYKQLLIAIGLMRALKVKRKKMTTKQTKEYLMNICEQLAVECDNECKPYGLEIEPIELEPAAVDEDKKHVCWFMKEPPSDEESEIEEEEEEEPIKPPVEIEVKPTEEVEEGEEMEGEEEEEGEEEAEGAKPIIEGEGAEEEEEFVGVGEEEEALAVELEEEEGVPAEGEGEAEVGEAPAEVGEAPVEVGEGEEGEEVGIEGAEEQAPGEGEEGEVGEEDEEGEEGEGGEEGEEGGAAVEGEEAGAEEMIGELGEEFPEGLEGYEEFILAEEEWLLGPLEEEEEEAPVTEEPLPEEVLPVEEVEEEVPVKEEVAVAEPPKVEILKEHPPGTVSYLSWKVYSAWLEEFGNNINTYGKCLRTFREIIESKAVNYSDTVKIETILTNWGAYLKDSLDFERRISEAFKGRPITKCAKCGDYTLYDIPRDHEIPPELKTAVESTARWRLLLTEAEKLCKSFLADDVSILSHESIEIIDKPDSDLASSEISEYSFEEVGFPVEIKEEIVETDDRSRSKVTIAEDAKGKDKAKGGKAKGKPKGKR